MGLQHIKLPHLGILFAASFLVAPASADAQATSSAIISNLQFSLSDLEPSDSLTPSMSFSIDGKSSLEGSLDWVYQTRFLIQGTSGFGSVSHTAGNDSSAIVHASVEGVGPYKVKVDGSAQSGHSYYVQAYAPNTDKSFTLSPKTRLTITADTQLMAYISEGKDSYAEAYAALAIYDPTNFNGNNYTALDSMYLQAVNVGVHGTQDRQLNIVLENSGATEVSYNFYSFVKASGQLIAVSAVPEPGSFALLLAGSGILAGVARRRSGRSATIGV
jgi:hypothetical protein